MATGTIASQPVPTTTAVTATTTAATMAATTTTTTTTTLARAAATTTAETTVITSFVAPTHLAIKTSSNFRIYKLPIHRIRSGNSGFNHFWKFAGTRSQNWQRRYRKIE